MYLDHFGLNEPPFRITPHTDFFFAGANRGATLDALLYAISHDEGIVKVAGEVGSGKTMLCRVLMEQLPDNVETIYLANPSLAREEILFAIADELRLEIANERPTRLMRALLEHLIALYAEGRRVVVLIDEAHAMPRETLEEIRLLSNLEANRHKLLQIVLFGQPELDDHLNTAQLRQLMDRITHTFRLEPLTVSDVGRYIEFRMRAAGYRGPNVFSPNAVRRIAEASGGLTRRVNILADKSLLAAFAANTHAVTLKEARRAVRDSEFHRARRNWRPFALAAAGVAAGLVIGLSLDSVIRDRAPVDSAHRAALGAAPSVVPTGRSQEAQIPGATVRVPQAPPAVPAPPVSPPSTTGSAIAALPLTTPASAPALRSVAQPAKPLSTTGAAIAALPLTAPASAPALRSAAQPAPPPSTTDSASPALPLTAPPSATPPSAQALRTSARPAEPPSSGSALSTSPVALGKSVAAALQSIQPARGATQVWGTEASTQAPDSPPKPRPPARGEIARERFAATQDWLETAPGDYYALQLLTVKDVNVARLEGFLLRAIKMAPREDFHIYSVKIDDAQWYRLAYGLFSNFGQARVAMQQLPPLFSAEQPFYRTIQRMRSQNRQ